MFISMIYWSAFFRVFCPLNWKSIALPLINDIIIAVIIVVIICIGTLGFDLFYYNLLFFSFVIFQLLPDNK